MNKSNNPDLECHVHNDETAKEFLKEHFGSYVLAAYNGANHPSQKGDIFRLAYLYKMGGYYIDVDDLVFVDLKRCFAGVGSAYFLESIGHVGNNFLATMSGNRIFEDMLIEASENVSTGAFGGCIWRGTGPGLVSRHVARQVNDIIQNGRARNVRIALPWEHKKISTYHLTLNYKKAGFHWMGGDEAEEQDG
jgi:mannosyltransferase OCH1-like enzyme